jgi:hypothetical protein
MLDLECRTQTGAGATNPRRHDFAKTGRNPSMLRAMLHCGNRRPECPGARAMQQTDGATGLSAGNACVMNGVGL